MKKIPAFTLAVITASLLSACNSDSVDNAIKHEKHKLTQDIIATTIALELPSSDTGAPVDTCYAVASNDPDNQAYNVSTVKANLQSMDKQATIKTIHDTNVCKDLGVNAQVTSIQVYFDNHGGVAELFREIDGIQINQDFQHTHGINYKKAHFGRIELRKADQDNKGYDSSFAIETKDLKSDALYVTSATVKHGQDANKAKNLLDHENQFSFDSMQQLIDKSGLKQLPSSLISQESASKKWSDNLISEIQ
ncbi:hypothetical protein [Vibrio rarus]|uniref:hypothetical protein n=1 Tax=Vibrio rarus TaxID=413403 RepID=UPI0021C3C081|nr:hypothetical protein [Vibrio rarus]